MNMFYSFFVICSINLEDDIINDKTINQKVISTEHFAIGMNESWEK